MKKFKELSEQHAEHGRFKPVRPRIVKSHANLTPRSKSDSADVKLREDFDVCKTCKQDPCICSDSFGFATDKKEHMKKEEVQQVDEIVKPDVKNDIKSLDAVSFMKKHGVKKGQAKNMAEESSMAEKQAQKQYRNARKDDVPFDPPYSNTKKPSVVPGKFGSGYSTARHLARQAMNRVSAKYKTPIKEEGELTRKSQIIKDAAKKKTKKTDSFCADPIISKSEVKM